MYSFLPLLLVALVVPAYAGVYKCANEKGGVTYQDAACAPGRELRNLDVDAATVSVVPLTLPAHKSVPASATKPAQLQNGTAMAKNATERKRLQTGMSEAEVIQKVGHADVESEGRAKEGRRWTYLPTEGDPDTVSVLTTTDGKVSHIERKVMR